MMSSSITSTQLSAELQSVANTILAVLAPNSARLVRTAVTISDNATTASTDGNLVIILPIKFCGHAIPEDAAVAVGLLAHEAGHFIQPLAEVIEVEANHRLPHWLANVVLDVQGEAFVTGVFPALSEPLRATRKAVRDANLGDYRTDLLKAVDIRTAAAPAILMSRFNRPEQSFDPAWISDSSWQSHPWQETIKRLLREIDTAATLAAERLPAFLQTLIQQFPELRQAALPQLPNYGKLHTDALGGCALREASTGGAGFSPGGIGRLLERHFSTEVPEADAQKLAKILRVRFEAALGRIEVAAPGRLHRHALVRGDPLPFRMELPGHSLPSHRVVLCLDISGSMGGRKLSLARLAGQAIALAVMAQDGDVVGILFSDDGITGSSEAVSPLFAPLREWYPQGGTSFEFLAHVWRRWPEHLVLLLTDGYGALPTAFEADRKRTSAVVIGGDVQQISSVVAHAIPLDDLKSLPVVLTMLLPRRQR